MFSFTPPCRTAVFLARIVMPFSRSRSIESITRSATSWFSRKAPDCHSIASTSVVLPWSTCATIATFRRSSRARPVMDRPSSAGVTAAARMPAGGTCGGPLLVRAGGGTTHVDAAAVELGVQLQLPGDLPHVVCLVRAHQGDADAG